MAILQFKEAMSTQNFLYTLHYDILQSILVGAKCEKQQYITLKWFMRAIFITLISTIQLLPASTLL